MKTQKDTIEVRSFMRGFDDFTVIINDQVEIECVAEFEYKGVCTYAPCPRVEIKKITPFFPSGKVVEIQSCINELLHEEFVYLNKLKKIKYENN